MTFTTERLQFAIYVHASGRLPFIGCEPVGSNGKLRFVFEDPQGRGPEVELEFDRGESIPATAIFASQKFLRRMMSQASQKNRRNESGNYR